MRPVSLPILSSTCLSAQAQAKETLNTLQASQGDMQPLGYPLGLPGNSWWCTSETHVSFPILNCICLSAQAQAEETLNTLHFASMALRVKCNPLCILDPQDKLVLNLRGTISKLRSQNKQLSTALQRSRSHSGGSGGSDRDPDFEHEPVSVLFECDPTNSETTYQQQHSRKIDPRAGKG